MDKRIAIVTGASSGLGAEFVKQLDEREKLMKFGWLRGAENVWRRCRKKFAYASSGLCVGSYGTGHFRISELLARKNRTLCSS